MWLMEHLPRSNTITESTVHKDLKIPRENAAALVEFRNALVHKGCSYFDAIKIAWHKIKSNHKKVNPKILSTVIEGKVDPAYFALAVFDLLLSDLARRSGIPIDWVRRSSCLSFLHADGGAVGSD
ncbi:hypothetical protein E4656_13525 [Natronospirillum operosum]|uniref:Uncharacterized protein n=1 Tax=Natronospirillum operosum TaxID=2759953 RepID=A0A4Z0W8X7_9GAMM|nr:hypothetical protein [Natronospirillum operosum]TGG92488.1 hypothetical protein E4656_13525 [Natronospirillum operosum]